MSWHDDTFPELRSAPPWVMEEMVEAQPGLARALQDSASDAAELAAAVRTAHSRSEPVVVTGCGTSEHAAQAVAALLSAALAAPVAQARQALEAAARPRPGLCIGVSHEGGTAATAAALLAARAAGARTALITAVPSGRAAQAADLVLTTPLVDRSWCHTVGYVSPILAGGLVSAALGAGEYDGDAIERYLARLVATPVDASPLARAERLVAAGAGADAVTARELALKVAEGAQLPSAVHSLENVLHGHLAAHDSASAFVVVATGPATGLAAGRANHVLGAARRIGLPIAAISSSDTGPGLQSDLDVQIELPDDVPSLLGRLLGGAVALQLLTLALAAERGINPDLLRRDEEPYREAAALVDEQTASVFDRPE